MTSRIDKPVTPAPSDASARKRPTIQKWLVVVGVLVVSHIVSAIIGYDRLNGHIFPGITVDSPIDAWIAATRGMDVSSYLETAKNFAAGKGIVAAGALGEPDKLGPFVYWGPGTPFVFGAWLKLTGGTTIWSCFLFSALLQFIAGAIAVMTAAVFTRRTWALATTAFLSACFPPLHSYFYSESLTSSEIAALVPLGMGLWALCVGGFRIADRRRSIFNLLWWFSGVGLWIGLASLARDSLSAFATFVAVALVFACWPRTRRQWGVTLACSAAVVLTTMAVRLPVELWNYKRIHIATVSTSRIGAIWRAGLWSKHDAVHWFEEAGIGLGEYLDPAAASRVEAYYREKNPDAALYSLSELAQAVWHHPLEALAFKLSRLQVLWLGTSRQPLPSQYFQATWCLAFYGLFFVYLAARGKHRLPIPMALYFYPLFLACASVLIHYEFRYTFPMWQMFMVLPALWAAHLADVRAIANSKATIDGDPTQRAEDHPGRRRRSELAALTSA